MASRLFGQRRGVLVAIVGVAAYTVLVGASASVVRAAIMGSLALIAQQLGRRTAGLNTLAAAVVVMTLLNPFTLWDVGFQLSVAATFGLIVYADPLEQGFRALAARVTSPARAAQFGGVVAEFFLLTLAAQLTTLPLIAFYFQRISLVSFIANIIILPPQPAVMVVGGLALIAGLIAIPLGKLVALAAWPFTAFTIAFVQWFAQWPRASIALGEMSLAFVIGTYALLLGGTWLFSRPMDQRPRWLRWPARAWLESAVLAALGVGAFLVWSYYFSLPDGRLRVTVLDVGDGDGILIQTPSGAHVLIDGGPSGGALNRALAAHWPLFTERIDVLVIAAPGESSLGGLPDALARYDVGQVVLTGAPGQTATYRAVLQALSDKGLTPTLAADKPTFDLGDGVILSIIHDDEQGSMARLAMGKFVAWFPIGWDKKDPAVWEGVGPGTALIVPGDRVGAIPADAVWRINARVTVLALGAEAAGDIQFELENFEGRQVWRTDRDGAVTILTDGARVWVETEK